MTKISLLPNDSTPVAGDILAGVQTSIDTTENFKLSDLLAFLLGNGASSQFKLNFGNGTQEEALIDGLSQASSQNIIQVGKTLIQFQHVTLSMPTASNTYTYTWSWPFSFPTAVQFCWQSVLVGNSLTMNGPGVFESLSINGGAGFMQNTGAGGLTAQIYLM